jgi:hypothetical protein
MQLTVPHLHARLFVGASLLAMVVNEDACLLDKRSALEHIASKLAPTQWCPPGGGVSGLRFDAGKQVSIATRKLSAFH